MAAGAPGEPSPTRDPSSPSHTQEAVRKAQSAEGKPKAGSRARLATPERTGRPVVVMATVPDTAGVVQKRWLGTGRRWDSPMVTGGTTGSVEDGLAFTGMGVVGPFTIT